MSSTVPCILYVEDDPNDVLLFQRAVRKSELPLQLTSVEDGEALQRYLGGESVYSDREKFPLPGLVLLDLKLPRFSGIEVLSWIRSNAAFSRLPVAMFTSSRHDLDINQAYDHGANSYLVKPVEFDALVQMIVRIHAYWFELNHTPIFRQAGLGR